MPAEWEPHERCLMAWTGAEKWGKHLEAARRSYAEVANTIAAFEPLTMLVNTEDVAGARRTLASDIEIVEMPFEHAWTRDSGPIVVVDEGGNRAGIDFRFNSWGEKFLPYEQTSASAGAVLVHLGIERIESSMVLEGGAITVDGQGTLITTEQCLLNANRNPSMSREEIEQELGTRLGIEKIIWLPWGITDDWVTDGHVDAVCTFAHPGVVLVQPCDDPSNPDYDRLAANLDVLASATDAKGRSIELIELPPMPSGEVDGAAVPTIYTNVYLANGGVIVPVGDSPSDADATAILEETFPDREVVGVQGALLSYAGGGPHCVTMQIPAPQHVP
ncbi:MAG: agmatine deiminase family protein [Actinomycetia bacterium]|nr:agmatine deiminase family protein [Actinomycetes bacterium]